MRSPLPNTDPQTLPGPLQPPDSITATRLYPPPPAAPSGPQGPAAPASPGSLEDIPNPGPTPDPPNRNLACSRDSLGKWCTPSGVKSACRCSRKGSTNENYLRGSTAESSTAWTLQLHSFTAPLWDSSLWSGKWGWRSQYLPHGMEDNELIHRHGLEQHLAHSKHSISAT